MCFSTQASFAVGGALLPAAAYCITAAVRKNRWLLPLALGAVGLWHSANH